MTGGYGIVDVFDEVDGCVYEFPTMAAADQWALTGEPTFTSIRDAEPEDVTVDELWTWFNQSAPTAATPHIFPA